MTLLNRSVRSGSTLQRSLVLLAAIACAAFGQTVEELRLTVGKSIVLDYPSDVRQISTSDPAIVDAIAVSTREILLHAKANGTATLVVWSKAGQRTIYSVTVEQNLEPLRRLLRETFPNENVQVQSSRDALSLTGNVSTKEVSDRIVALASSFGRTVVNNVKIAPVPVEKQILLRVKFAELDRSVGQAFGVNLLSTGAGNTVGRVTTGQFGSPNIPAITDRDQPLTFSISDALNIFAFRRDINIAAMIRALQTEGVLQILAEPNLVTTNGKEATFLVGGEFPVPILQGGGNAGAVTVQFREFGIRLNFNPVVTENNTIKMSVKPEVSTIDLGNAVTLAGFVIPALATRRMETNIELSQGQSFVIGGLIDDRVQETISKIPGLANIPLLGAIFKSREERKNRTELLVLVTPEIVQPLNPGDPVNLPPTPREFLVPITPTGGTKSGAAPGRSAVRPEKNKKVKAKAEKEQASKS